MNPLIYRPTPTTRVKIDMVFPWHGKEYKIKEVSLNDYQDHILAVTKKVKEKNDSSA